jgi:hypothetical protein
MVEASGAFDDGRPIATSEKIPQLIVDRFPSLICNFKMATAKLVEERRIFEPAAPSA